MQYLGKMIIGDVTLPLFDGVFKILYLIITLRLISQRNFPDWQIAFEKADAIMIVNWVQIMNNHHKAVKALKDTDLFRGKWPWCMLLHAENLSKSFKQDRPVSNRLPISADFFLLIFQSGLFPHSYIVFYGVSVD